MEVILNINDLEYQNIFNKITLSVEKSKIITIAGANNCGKTTLSRILDRKIQDNFNINLLGKDIKDYSLEEYDHLIQVVYPTEGSLEENTPIEELERKEVRKEKIEFFKKELKDLKLLEKEVKKISTKEKIWVELLSAIGKAEEIVVIDNIDYYFSKKELDRIYEFIRSCAKEFLLSFLIMTTSLDHSLLTDTLYILKEGEIILGGEPLNVLQKDNIINKAGLNVPFMIDLSVKLRDYELIKNVELDKERLVDTLWN